jgi:hypothetical protein
MGGVLADRWWRLIKEVGPVKRWSPAVGVLGVAVVAAVVTYEDASALVWARRDLTRR